MRSVDLNTPVSATDDSSFSGLTARLMAVVVLALGSGSMAQPDPQAPSGNAPPPAPPVQHRSFKSSATTHQLSVPSGSTPYSIGDPSDDEQLYLENANRARRDPATEGLLLQASTDPEVLERYKFFVVDLARMASQMAALAPTPPLSMNARLSAAARVHSQDMLDNAFQGHVGTDGSTFVTRADAQGYLWSAVGENVFSFAHSVEEGHAGFEVDWGGDATTGGMQDPPGHRLNLHDPGFREIGVGVINGINGKVGPQVVTEDFGTSPSLGPFITGVVYYDLNGNGTWDPGEGLGGVTVQVTGSTFYAMTARSGGYSVPVPRPGTYSVTFSVSGLSDAVTNALVSNDNVKLDHALVYLPPVISGSGEPTFGEMNSYTFSPVGGAQVYQWKSQRLIASTGSEGAENGTNNVTVAISGSYPVIDTAVQASGQATFHLVQPTPDDQFLSLNKTFRPGPTASLSFASRLGWASAAQVARAQISLDGGSRWQDVWSQTGSGAAGQTEFATETVPLAKYAEQPLTVRFVYDYTGGSYFADTDPGVGWYIDDISLSDASELVDEAVADASPGTSFEFVPPAPGAYILSVRPGAAGRSLPWGPGIKVVAQAGSTKVRIKSVRRQADGGLQIDFQGADVPSGVYDIQEASELTGPWVTQSAASVSGSGADAFRATLPAPSGGRRFYRVFAR